MVATPLVPADYLDMVDPLRAGARQLCGKVVAITPLTEDSVAIRLRPGRAWAGHVAGQYLRVGVDIDGVRQWRTYSLTSVADNADNADNVGGARAPGAGPRHGRSRVPGDLSIAVKEVPGGLVSPHLVRSMRVGTLIYLGQATGEFVLPDPPPAKVAFITGGSGITPVIGILRTLADRLGGGVRTPAATAGYPGHGGSDHGVPDGGVPDGGVPGLSVPDHGIPDARVPGQSVPGLSVPDIVLVHGSRHRADVMFGDELRALATGALAGVLTVHETYSDTEGFLTPERLEELIPDLSQRSVWSCGPAGLVDLVSDMAAQQRTGPLTTEPFTPAPTITGTGGHATLTSAATGADIGVDVDGDTSILQAAEAAGAALPSGCRMGICFRCVVPLVEGAVSDLRTGEVTLAGDAVTVQTCISTPAGPCRLDV